MNGASPVHFEWTPDGENGDPVVWAVAYKRETGREVCRERIDASSESARRDFALRIAERLKRTDVVDAIAELIEHSLPEIKKKCEERHAAPAVRRKKMRPTRYKIANVDDDYYYEKNKHGVEEKIPVMHYLTIDEIAEQIWKANAGFPKVAGGCLYAIKGKPGDFPNKGSIRWIASSPDLFAFLGKNCDIRWAAGDATDKETGEKLTPHTKEDLLSHLKECPQESFLSVEVLPHYPPVENVYYIPWQPPSIESLPIPSPLQILINKFNADSPMDRDLMYAALLTLGWGGPPGQRPIQVITSDHPGKGHGKTQTVAAMCKAFGGFIEFRAKEDPEKIRSRLLSDDALAKRAGLFDNVKGKFYGGEIESLITAEQIDGHKMYHGQASRLNLMTYFVTANSPSLSEDVAERAVLIKIGKQKHTEDFASWARVFIPKHRAEIVAEIMHILAAPAECQIETANRDRWVAWQDAILTRFPNGNDLAAEIIKRRPGMNSELDDANEIYGAVMELVKNIPGYEGRVVKITRQQLHAKLLSMDVIDKSFNPKGVTTFIKERIGMGALKCLRDERSASERYWLYTGPEADPQDDPYPIS